MKSKSKNNRLEMKRRKEEGVFYTPEYMTDYICRNTIVPYLSKGSAKNIKTLILEYQEEINVLEDKLKSIKILDPACGSGVFLIKAVTLLSEISKEIKLIKEQGENYKKIKKEKLVNNKELDLNLEKWIDMEDIRQIIESGIYGVDIDENSVENTKANLNSKLTGQDKDIIDLSQNIRCGDSLIEDPSLKGNLAFIWTHKFPEVINKGGFDIIIGNPPYINIIEDLESKRYYKKRFPEIYTGKNDIYYYFFQKAIELCKKDGYITFISPRYLMEAFKAKKLREYILKETAIQKIIDFSDFKIFEYANIDTAIYFLKKTCIKDKIIIYKLVKPMLPPLRIEPPFFENYIINQNQLKGEKWYFIRPALQTILDKIESKATGRLKDFTILSKGIQTGKDSVFVLTEEKVEKYSIERGILGNWLKNSQISRFGLINPRYYIIISNRKTIKELSDYPNLEKYLQEQKEELLNRSRVDTWFHWRKGDERFTIDWNKPKIITPYKSASNNFTIDDKRCYFSQDIVLILPEDGIDIRYLLAYLNSGLCEFYFKIKGKKLGTVYEYYPRQIENLPFIKTEKRDQKVFIKIVERIFELNEELKSQKEESKERNFLREEIFKSEKKIDQLFYTLFDLKEEEIGFIKKNINYV
ncbi:MAG: Eco57I restriction-modification methylase domain-containing protein [Promethearchaeota archaeon]